MLFFGNPFGNRNSKKKILETCDKQLENEYKEEMFPINKKFYRSKPNEECTIQTHKEQIVLLESELKKKALELELTEQTRQEQEVLIQDLRMDNELKTNVIKQEEEHQYIFGLEIQKYGKVVRLKNDKILQLEKMIEQQMRREGHLVGHIKYLDSIHDESLLHVIKQHGETSDDSNIEEQTVNLDRLHKKQKIICSKIEHTNQIYNLRDSLHVDLRGIPSVPQDQRYKLTCELKSLSIAITNLQHSCGKLVEEAIALRNMVIQHASVAFDSSVSFSQDFDTTNELKYGTCKHLDAEWVELDLRLQSVCSEVASIRENLFEKEVDKPTENISTLEEDSR